MGFSSAECSGSPFSVALEVGQPDVIADVAFGIVHVVNVKLLGILGLIGPEQLNFTCGTVVVLGLLKSQDVVDFQIAHEPFVLVLSLVSHQLFYDGLAERWLIKLCEWPNLRTLLCWIDYPFELMCALRSETAR